MKRVVREHRLDSIMCGWIIQTARKNLWRVPTWYVMKDLVQDGYLCYAVCNKKYPSLKRQHFMSLVQVSYLRHITDLANTRTSLSLEVLYSPEDTVWMQATPEEATFVTLMRQAPPELQELIKILLTNASKVPRMKRDDRTWETLNEHLCRLVNVDGSVVNMKQVFTEHFISSHPSRRKELACPLKKNLSKPLESKPKKVKTARSS